MSSLIEELRRANPRARKGTPDQLIKSFKERVRATNLIGATSMRLTRDDMCTEVLQFIEQEGFQLLDEITIGCGRNIVDERDPNCTCCQKCKNRERVTHKRVSWKEQ